jgi:hypothetical protein
MNAIRVSNRAARKLGMLTILMIVPAHAADITMTITGTIQGGTGDFLHLFGKDRNLIGKPFKVVLTFDDTKGKPMKPECNNGSGIKGDGEDSPGKAVLTIEGKSFEFGGKKNSHSWYWRQTRSGCSGSAFNIEVEDGTPPYNNQLGLRITPMKGKSLTQNPDWKASMSCTEIDVDNQSGFAIQGPGDSGDGGIFHITSVTVAGKKLGPGMFLGR